MNDCDCDPHPDGIHQSYCASRFITFYQEEIRPDHRFRLNGIRPTGVVYDEVSDHAIFARMVEDVEANRNLWIAANPAAWVAEGNEIRPLNREALGRHLARMNPPDRERMFPWLPDLNEETEDGDSETFTAIRNERFRVGGVVTGRIEAQYPPITQNPKRQVTSGDQWKPNKDKCWSCEKEIVSAYGGNSNSFNCLDCDVQWIKEMDRTGEAKTKAGLLDQIFEFTHGDVGEYGYGPED